MKRHLTCRLKDANGRVCRRPQKHRMHGAHKADCNVATELHHEFVSARKAYGKFEGDPFVRLTFLVRCSDRDYLRETYGSGGMALRLREMIAEDRGVSDARVRHHVEDTAFTVIDRDGDGRATYHPEAKEEEVV